MAENAGSKKTVNIAILGRFSEYLPEISDELWNEALETQVPAKFLELNKKAFLLGKESR